MKREFSQLQLDFRSNKPNYYGIPTNLQSWQAKQNVLRYSKDKRPVSSSSLLNPVPRKGSGFRMLNSATKSGKQIIPDEEATSVQYYEM